MPLELVRPPRASARGVLLGGALGGFFAGSLMLIASVIHSSLSGAGLSLPPRMIAGTFYGPMALVGGGGVIAIGILTHFAVAIVVGIVFAGLTLRIESTAADFFLGIVYGIAVWAFMTFVTLAVFNDTMLVRVALSGTWWFFLHWIYGGFLGLFTPGLRRALAGPVPRQVPSPQDRLAA